MKRLTRHVVLALAMSTSLVLVAPAIASAKDGPTPMQEYRLALRAYNAYKHASAVLFKNLNAELANARATEKFALRSAKSPAQRYIAQLDYKETRATDITNWETAQSDLGPQPPLPQLPVVTSAGATTTTTVVASIAHSITTLP